MSGDISKYLATASVGENAYLGIKTVIQGMAIVFAVLIILSLIVMLVTAIINSMSKGSTKSVAPANAPVAPAVAPAAVAQSAGVSQAGTKGEGHLVTDGVGSEEEVAVIMAAVAAHSGAGLDSLNFKSIKAVD